MELIASPRAIMDFHGDQQTGCQMEYVDMSLLLLLLLIRHSGTTPENVYLIYKYTPTQVTSLVIKTISITIPMRLYNSILKALVIGNSFISLLKSIA